MSAQLQQQHVPVQSANSRSLPFWLMNNGVSLILSSYNTGCVLAIGVSPQQTISMYETNLLRPMGMTYANKTLWLSTIGNLLRFEDKGETIDKSFGPFDRTFLPTLGFYSGDVDVHDMCVNSKGQLFYVSALFSCVCRPSETKSFTEYWRPPWIDRLVPEDRCHLNGLCLVDDVPRYVTAACMSNDRQGWHDIKGEGVVYDIVENRIVCSGLFNPHSPKFVHNRLWILESGTGYLGIIDVDTCTFEPKIFIPTFLRGLTFYGKYAIVAGSLDRHDNAFGDLPLGAELKHRKLRAKCGFWTINLEDMSIGEHMEFTHNSVREIYDIIAIPGVRPKIVDLHDPYLIDKYYLA